MSQVARHANGDVPTILSLSQAQRRKRDFGAVLTLEDPGASSSQRLRFHVKPAPQHMIMTLFDDDTIPVSEEGAMVAAARCIRDFGRSVSGIPLMIHCRHGIGRSPAAALLILCDRGWSADAALHEVLSQRPEAMPNLAFIKAADTLLSASISLTDALRRWEQANPQTFQRRRARASSSSRLALPPVFRM